MSRSVRERGLNGELGGILDLALRGRYRAKEMPAFAASRQSETLDTPPGARTAVPPRPSLPDARLFEQNSGTNLHDYYDALFAAYGPQGWWPGRTRFEVIVGAILVQNTSWANAALAIGKLAAREAAYASRNRRCGVWAAGSAGAVVRATFGRRRRS